MYKLSWSEIVKRPSLSLIYMHIIDMPGT